jgi:hypothetical protein
MRIQAPKCDSGTKGCTLASEMRLEAQRITPDGVYGYLQAVNMCLYIFQSRSRAKVVTSIRSRHQPRKPSRRPLNDSSDDPEEAVQKIRHII